MKKWTVMLIPHDRGGTRTLTLSALHFAIVAALLVTLSFTSTFFFQRHRAVVANAKLLHEAKRELERQVANAPAEPAKREGLTDEEAEEIESRLRAEYESSLAAIAAELNDLHDMEARARDITGLAPRRKKVEGDLKLAGSGGGKGGGSGGLGSFTFSGVDDEMRPPHIIYGLSRPSADLILEEIRLRTRSLGEYVHAAEAQVEKVERQPTIWPLVRGIGRITSTFGYRRDPIHGRIRHHDGTDIAATPGTVVRSTAKGVVKSSGFDRDFGNLVVIDHGNGLETWYAHLSKRLVAAGDEVNRSDAIGKVGSTGRSTGPHLHYEVHKNGVPVDSLKYLTD